MRSALRTEGSGLPIAFAIGGGTRAEHALLFNRRSGERPRAVEVLSMKPVGEKPASSQKSRARTYIEFAVFAVLFSAIPFVGGIFVVCTGLVMLLLNVRASRAARIDLELREPSRIDAARTGEFVRVRGSVVGADAIIAPVSDERGVAVLVQLVRSTGNQARATAVWAELLTSDLEIVDGSSSATFALDADTPLVTATSRASKWRGRKLPPEIVAALAEHEDALRGAVEPYRDPQTEWEIRETVLKADDVIEVDGLVQAREDRSVGGFRDDGRSAKIAIRPTRVSSEFGERLQQVAETRVGYWIALMGLVVGGPSVWLWKVIFDASSAPR